VSDFAADVAGPEPWAGRWRVVARPGAIAVDVPARPWAWAKAAARVRALKPGTPLALLVRTPGGRALGRSFARRAGVTIEREYLALPGPAAPAYLVEDTPEAIRTFWRAAVTIPPGVAVAAPLAEGAMRVVEVLSAWRLLGALLPGRILVGARP
jgi:hypothetical protein